MRDRGRWIGKWMWKMDNRKVGKRKSLVENEGIRDLRKIKKKERTSGC